MSILEQGGIVRLKIIFDDMFFMYEAISQALNTWLKQLPQEGTSKTVGENKSLIVLQFQSCSVRLSDANRLPIEAVTYLPEGLTKCSVEEFSKPFDMIL